MVCDICCVLESSYRPEWYDHKFAFLFSVSLCESAFSSGEAGLSGVLFLGVDNGEVLSFIIFQCFVSSFLLLSFCVFFFCLFVSDIHYVVTVFVSCRFCFICSFNVLGLICSLFSLIRFVIRILDIYVSSLAT